MRKRNCNQGGVVGYGDERILFICQRLLAAEAPLGCLSWGRVDSLLRDNPRGSAGTTHYPLFSHPDE